MPLYSLEELPTSFSLSLCSFMFSLSYSSIFPLLFSFIFYSSISPSLSIIIPVLFSSPFFLSTPPSPPPSLFPSPQPSSFRKQYHLSSSQSLSLTPPSFLNPLFSFSLLFLFFFSSPLSFISFLCALFPTSPSSL